MSDKHGIFVATYCRIGKQFADGSFQILVTLEERDAPEFLTVFEKNSPCIIARMSGEAALEYLQAQTANDLIPEPEEKPLYGKPASQLRRSASFMGNPKVWAALGNDADFLAWIRLQPCAECKTEPHYEMSDFIKSEAAHVRRVSEGSGTSIKPEYCAIPLCRSCHRIQHDKGESELHNIASRGGVDKIRMAYVYRWVWATLKEELGFEHMNQVPPSLVREWTEAHKLAGVLPDSYGSE